MRARVDPAASLAGASPPAVLTLLAELVAAVLAQSAEIRGLRADLAAGRGAPNAGSEAMANLLREIVAYCGDQAFSTSALTAHAEGAPALSAAIIGAAGILNARAVGKVLKKWEGVDVGGLQVQRLGLDAAGVIWKVVEVLK